ncbi:hypothetical protein DE146DRAFT_680977 [Phaeosphaeria sp. MPI-PUGE-AT-0046c]|nr:hypothetical protein DE146DRAFT_680977 [Phaeosphaeria sp. MPI-PUGE-AT-0046c]
MSDQASEHVFSKYRYEFLFGAWLLVTGGTFLRISKQPYSSRLKIEQYESIFKGTSLSAVNVWNPIYALAPFVLVVVSIPLAVCAVITTSLAVTLLACRAAVVYVQLTVALIGAWVDPRPSKPSFESAYSPLCPSPEGKSPARQRHRNSNISSTSSQETIVPAPRLAQPSNNSLPLKVSVVTNEAARDYEGVGGWRTPGDDDEEALWMNMNSRLELPREAPSRRHQRSLTGGSTPVNRRSWSPESLRMSPVQSRARTPVRFAVEDGDYFPPQWRTNTRRGSIASESSKKHNGRKSESSSSSTSPGIMIAAKETGE